MMRKLDKVMDKLIGFSFLWLAIYYVFFVEIGIEHKFIIGMAMTASSLNFLIFKDLDAD